MPANILEREISLAQEVLKPKLKSPRLYRVIMHNDDFTPMEFVINVLETFFNMSRNIATQIMYEIHTKGEATCGLFSKDVAETKADFVVKFARSYDHPLLCSLKEGGD